MRAERRRFWFILMPTVALVLIVAVLAGALLRDGDDGTEAGAASPNGARSIAPQTLLLGHRGTDGRMDLLILVGTGPSSASTLLFPVATQVEVPSLGPQTLADLPNDGADHNLLQTTVENLLGVKVAKTLVLDDAGLNAALEPAAPFEVDLHREVQFDDDANGIIPAGAHRASTADAARLLVARQSGSELDQLVTVQDVLDGWSRRLRNPSVARATLKAQPDLTALVAGASASDRRTDTLPVESVTTDGSERFDPRNADVVKYVTEAFPHALLTVGGRRPRVEILNGTGAVGLAQSIAEKVVPAGGQVTLTGNVQDFGLTNTQVVFYRKADRGLAQHLLDALGCGALKEADTEIGVVDVTILAGADCFQTGAAPSP